MGKLQPQRCGVSGYDFMLACQRHHHNLVRAQVLRPRVRVLLKVARVRNVAQNQPGMSLDLDAGSNKFHQQPSNLNDSRHRTRFVPKIVKNVLFCVVWLRGERRRGLGCAAF